MPGTNGSVTVTDMNALFAGGVEEGWLYLGSDGKTRIQFNYAQKSVWSGGFNVFFAGFQITAVGATSGVLPFTGSWPSSSAVPQKCETQGQTFQSGASWA